MKNIGIAALAAIAALVLGFGAQLGTQTARAEVTGSVAVGCEFLAGAIDGDTDDATAGADYTEACDGLDAADIANLAAALGDEDDELEASDLEDIAGWGGNQILDANDAATAPTATGAGFNDEILLFAFLDDDEVVRFDAAAGVTVNVNDDDGGFSADGDANAETCDAADDDDCDNSTPSTDDGDGIVVATVVDATADDDDTVDVDISQADDTSEVSTQTINIQGAADEVSIVALESVIGTSDDASDCTEEADASDGADQLGDLEKTVVIATVEDSDGDALTRVVVSFSADGAVLIDETESAETGADPSFDTGVTVDAGDAGVAAFAVVCGDEDTGDGSVTALINEDTAGEEDATVDISVVGGPANVALTASPAAIDCDGTASSTVSATVTDADGNNVVDGTNVNFSVVALGIASPINADTTDGVASSTITPLSAGVAGVTVIVQAGGSSGPQASIRVDCNPAAAPTTAPGASPTPTTGIAGPDTGSGGYLGQDSSAGFPMWTLVALTLGAVALAAGGMVTKKVTR